VFIIIKWWANAPLAIQPATQRRFSNREAADRVKAELAETMPGRCFAVVEQRPC
jgi:hypothetical protein